MKTSILAICVLFPVSALVAQTKGSITGSILTASEGTPVPKAQVRAKNTVTGASFSALSDGGGNYKLASLPPGNYEITAEFPPLFLPFRRENVQVQVGQPVRLDVPLSDVQLNTLGDGGSGFVWLSSEHPAPAGRAPRTRDGKPDLSGVWLPALPQPLGEPPEPLPWAAALVKERGENHGKDAPQVRCLPMGLTWSGLFTHTRFVQTPSLLVIIDENGDPARQVYLDGRSHPKDPNPSYMGHSVGHWEGDTLVVDTVGFNDRTWLTFANYPQTEKMHVIERYRRPDLGHLEVEMTFDDPGAFRKPWQLKRVKSLAVNETELMEYVCAENERDRAHMAGK